MTEQTFRRELVASREALFGEEKNGRLMEVLTRERPDIKAADVLYWTPEQTEDIYGVLVNGDEMVYVELDRIDQSIKPIISKEKLKDIPVSRYRIDRIKLLVAMDLSIKDMRIV